MYQHLEIPVGDSNLSMSCIRNNSCTPSDIKIFNSVDFGSKIVTGNCFPTGKTQTTANI